MNQEPSSDIGDMRSEYDFQGGTRGKYISRYQAGTDIVVLEPAPVVASPKFEIPPNQAFWSYVHADDGAEGGRIADLARDVAAQFEMSTGESLKLFVDKDAIRWGDDWRAHIDDSLASVAFFVAILTPRYFMSAECRRELQFFARQARNLGVQDLVLPILYVDVVSMHDPSPEDELIAMARTFQWEDWRELRFAERASEAYRRGVARLATRLVEANRQAERQIDPVQLLPPATGQEDEGPGVIDRLAATEDALSKLPESLILISQAIVQIGQLMSEATTEIDQSDKHKKGFAGRLLIAKRLARQLDGPVEVIWSNAMDFTSRLHQVDDGFRLVIEQAPATAGENEDSRRSVCDFFALVRGFSVAARDSLASVQHMASETARVEGMARDLRPTMRRLREGLTLLVEAQEVIDEWVHLIEKVDIDCPDVVVIADTHVNRE
jgi:hypothetical protein